MSAEKTDKTRSALIGLGIAGFLGCLDLTIVNTALPAIQIGLNATITQLQWVMNILLLALTALMVIAGKLGDLYGKRLCLYFGLALFAFSSLIAGLSPNIQVLIICRFLQGVAIAFLYTAPIALVPHIFHEHGQGHAVGILISANGLGLAVGPLIGGLIVSALSWRWIFLINPPIILLSWIFCRRALLPEAKSNLAERKIDWLGAILFMISLPALILVIVEGEIWGWFSREIIALFACAIVGLILFYFVEHRVKAPIIEFHLFTQRVFIIGLISNFSLAVFYAVDFFLIPLYLHFIRGMAAYQIGLMMLPATAMVVLLSSTTGRIVDKKGPKVLLMIGLSLCIISAILQAQLTAITPVLLILLSYLLFGIAWACILSPSFVAAMSSVSRDASGVAMGTLGTLHNLGAAIGLAVGTLIYGLGVRSRLLTELPNSGDWIKQVIANTDNALQIIMTQAKLTLPAATEVFQNSFLHGYRWAMWLLVIASAIALVAVTFGLKKSADKTQTEKPIAMH